MSISLKSELLKLKKQAEELKKKEPKPIKVKSKTNSSNVNDSSEKKFIEIDDSNNERSKRILEAKTKYYEQMTKHKINSSLVLFKDKAENESIRSTEEDVIEFTDCFGRTRKVEKSEFDRMKDQNIEIIEIPSASNEYCDQIGENFMNQKEEWKKQEELNTERNEVYYQDVLFDEARLHGTAWYKFSRDHEERIIQQENLVKMREKTEQAQNQHAELKKQRDDIIKNRIKLAKERIRSKLGLAVEQTKNSDTISHDSKDDERYKPKEYVEKQIDEKELQRERERKRHVRPWDKDKLINQKGSESPDDDAWTPKKEKFVLSQDDWNEIQRNKRQNEFAPKYNHRTSTSKQNNSTDVEKSVVANLRFIREKFDKN